MNGKDAINVNDPVYIDHLIFGAVPKEGYKLKSYSDSLIGPTVYDRIFNRNYVPILESLMEKLENEKVYLVLQPQFPDVIIFSKVTKTEIEDEYGRGSSQNHVAVIEKEIIKKEKISLIAILQAIGDAMDEFDQKYSASSENIDQLKIDKNKLYKRDFSRLKRIASKNVVESVLTLYLSNRDNKVFLLWEGSNYKNRLLLASILVELINFELDLPIPISYITGPPTVQAKKDLNFNLIISSLLMGFEHNSDNLVPYTIPEPRDERIDGNENIYQVLDKIYP